MDRAKVTAARGDVGSALDLGAWQRLADAGAQMAAMVSRSADAIIGVAVDGTILSWNRAAEALYGYTAAEAVGRHVDLIGAPGVMPDAAAVLARVAAGERILDFETVRRRRDGVLVEVSADIYPLRDERGAVGAMTCIARRLGRRRRAAHALSHSEERLALALRTGRMGIWEWEVATDRVFWSPECFEVVGVAREAFGETTLDFFERIHDDDRAAVQERVQAALRGERAFDVDFRFIRPDEEERWFRNIGVVVRDERGAPLRMVGTVQDVTDRKQVEKALQRAKEEAERANRAKDDFLALVSHELRTPLTAVLGWSRMISSASVKPAMKEEGLRIIERNARAQAKLVEDLLDISRIISGKLDVHLRRMDLATAVDAAGAAVRPAAEAKVVALVIDLAPSPIEGDLERLQQVVVNLLSNAVKFTPAGGLVRAVLLVDETTVTLRVSDNGKGMASELLPRVFDRFWQADASSTRRHGGLGLGLAIVRHVVELHGGSVVAESPGEGRGSTFTVRLPRADTFEAPGPEARAAGPDAAVLAGLRVLVVDDEPDARGVIQFVLERAGAEVTAVESVAEAFAALAGQPPPSLLLSDIAMPGEDGYALIRRLRESERPGRPRLPAVALTAHARTEDRIRALSAGFQSYVPKPVEPRELIAVVASLAGRDVR
ncbi:MAG: PAS domain S-box protein [Minicystis sp.]